MPRLDGEVTASLAGDASGTQWLSVSYRLLYDEWDIGRWFTETITVTTSDGRPIVTAALGPAVVPAGTKSLQRAPEPIALLPPGSPATPNAGVRPPGEVDPIHVSLEIAERTPDRVSKGAEAKVPANPGKAPPEPATGTSDHGSSATPERPDTKA